jgi:hypothetical protein
MDQETLLWFLKANQFTFFFFKFLMSWCSIVVVRTLHWQPIPSTSTSWSFSEANSMTEPAGKHCRRPSPSIARLSTVTKSWI